MFTLRVRDFDTRETIADKQIGVASCRLKVKGVFEFTLDCCTYEHGRPSCYTEWGVVDEAGVFRRINLRFGGNSRPGVVWASEGEHISVGNFTLSTSADPSDPSNTVFIADDSRAVRGRFV